MINPMGISKKGDHSVMCKKLMSILAAPVNKCLDAYDKHPAARHIKDYEEITRAASTGT